MLRKKQGTERDRSFQCSLVLAKDVASTQIGHAIKADLERMSREEARVFRLPRIANSYN